MGQIVGLLIESDKKKKETTQDVEKQKENKKITK